MLQYVFVNICIQSLLLSIEKWGNLHLLYRLNVIAHTAKGFFCTVTNQKVNVRSPSTKNKGGKTRERFELIQCILLFSKQLLEKCNDPAPRLPTIMNSCWNIISFLWRKLNIFNPMEMRRFWFYSPQNQNCNTESWLPDSIAAKWRIPTHPPQHQIQMWTCDQLCQLHCLSYCTVAKHHSGKEGGNPLK